MELPKLDLSRFAASGRLPAGSEQAVVFFLMNNQGDIPKACEWFSLPEAIVTAIAAKWYPQIVNASYALHKSDGVNDAIDDAVMMIRKDISAKKSEHEKYKNDVLMAGESDCLNKELDRLISIKSQSQKSYDSAIGGITAEIARQKALERLEQGDVKDDFQYLQNQKTVADLLGDDPSSTDLRKVYVFDTKKMRTRSYESKAKTASEMHMTVRKLEALLADHKLYRMRYVFSFSHRGARYYGKDIKNMNLDLDEDLADAMEDDYSSSASLPSYDTSRSIVPQPGDGSPDDGKDGSGNV